jgi:D-sedoheptulose 7-phosphate isomerase
MTKPINDFAEYAHIIKKTMDNIDVNDIDKMIAVIIQTYHMDRTIYVCGNGGSAALAEHLTCDCGKGIGQDTIFRPKIVSLPSNMSVMTAVANDFGYEQVFSKQLDWAARPSDILIAISSSGNSENIINALTEAKKIGMYRIAIVGFDGGSVQSIKNLCDTVIHIDSDNYGIVEDISQSIFHFVAQEIRYLYAKGDPNEIKY